LAFYFAHAQKQNGNAVFKITDPIQLAAIAPRALKPAECMDGPPETKILFIRRAKDWLSRPTKALRAFPWLDSQTIITCALRFHKLMF